MFRGINGVGVGLSLVFRFMGWCGGSMRDRKLSRRIVRV